MLCRSENQWLQLLIMLLLGLIVFVQVQAVGWHLLRDFRGPGYMCDQSYPWQRWQRLHHRGRSLGSSFEALKWYFWSILNCLNTLKVKSRLFLYQPAIYKDKVYIRIYSVVLTSFLCFLILPGAQVVGSSMPLVGEHQAEDRQLIADMVLTAMNQSAENEANALQRPTTIQPSQVW